MDNTENSTEGALGGNSNEEREIGQSDSSLLSLENPTREYLCNNFTKSQLQKHCRQLGLQKVWVNKIELVDMILRSTRTTEHERAVDTRDQSTAELLEKFLQDIDEVKENIAKKDSEIRELNEMLKNAHVTINRLNDRITTLEDQIGNQDINSNIPKEEKILLLGDDNLREVRVSDLNELCSVKSIKDINLDLLKCWINERLDIIPTKCILYCGLNDLNENDNVNSVLDDLGSVISELKTKNEEIELFVCELAPSLNENIDTKIIDFNEKLNQWSIVNGIKVVKMNLNFKLGTGEIDEMCYESSEDKMRTTLNRYGALRLLSVIHKQCSCLSMNGSIKENYGTTNQDDFPAKYNDHLHRKKIANRQIGGQLFQQRNIRHNDYNRRQEYRIQRQYPDSHRYTRTHESSNRQSDDRRQRGCFNCGEYNHRQMNCRYDHRIRCNYCYKFGHKSRMCTLQNN